jgi:hypothetical protein
MGHRKAMCLACGAQERRIGQYVCPGCWAVLPVETRRRLYRKDADARNRLFQLLSALRRGVALGAIKVSA